MKFLILAALLAMAAAYPTEESRDKRGVVWGAPGLVHPGVVTVGHVPAAHVVGVPQVVGVPHLGWGKVLVG